MAVRTRSRGKTNQGGSFSAQARKLNEYHHLSRDSQKDAIVYAKMAGEELISVKSGLPHGSYEDWIEVNFDGEPQTARKYARIAENWHLIEPEIENGISIVAAAKLIAKLKKKDDEAAPGGLVNISRLIGQLESVAPGLAIKAEFEGSHLFKFEDGRVWSFNDEIYANGPCDLPIQGGIHAAYLLDGLRRLKLKTGNVKVPGDKLVISGHKRQVTYTIVLNCPVDEKIPGKPRRWRKLPEGFMKALGMVAECASDDQSAYVYTCVRITPDYVEAMDNWQAGRYMIETGFKKSTFIRKVTIPGLLRHTWDEMAETSDWLHFRNSDGLMMACRRDNYDEEYPDIGEMIAFNGFPIVLPSKLSTAADRAWHYVENHEKEDRYVRINLDKSRLKVSSRCEDAAYTETLDVEYDGPPLTFEISAKTIGQFMNYIGDVWIKDDKLKITNGDFSYVTALKTAF